MYEMNHYLPIVWLELYGGTLATGFFCDSAFKRFDDAEFDEGFSNLLK